MVLYDSTEDNFENIGVQIISLDTVGNDVEIGNGTGSTNQNFANDKFTIVVPKTMQDFTDEGKMQNNCVGSYYHDSIADHQNLIYFIRKTSNPNKSYITCRYNLHYGKTTEFRTVNNNDVEDENAIELIDKLDKYITLKLRKEGII